MPYYEIFIDRPVKIINSRGYEDDYNQVWDRTISFVEKLKIGPRRFLLFGGRPVEFEVYSHDVATLKIDRDIEFVLKFHAENEEKLFKVQDKKPIPFLNFSDKEEVRRVKFRKSQEFAIYRTSFYLYGRQDQQVRWSGGMGGYGDFFEELCSAEIARVLENSPATLVLDKPSKS